MKKLPETVTLTTDEYLRLLEASLELEALQEAIADLRGLRYVQRGEIQDAMAGARAALEVDA